MMKMVTDYADPITVEAIRDKRNHKGKVQYLVKWSGLPESSSTWEPLKNLKSVHELIGNFEKSLNSSVKIGVTHDTRHDEEEPQQQLDENDVQQNNVDSSKNPPKIPGKGGNIVKVLRAVGYKARSQIEDEVIYFLAMRSGGTEIIVDYKTLRRNYQSLLLDFYEEKFNKDLKRSIRLD